MRKLVALLLLLPAFAAAEDLSPKLDIVLKAAREQIGVTISYDPSYARLSYPGGDVPMDRGVCTDVIVRAYRAAGIDLQALVHEDMKQAFAMYPRTWGLSRPDPNIDHRRVQNLAIYFTRHGKVLPISKDAYDYKPGDIVTWKLSDGRPHIGLVAGDGVGSGQPLVVHNIGEGAKAEAVLFDFTITGHYRFRV